MIGYLPTLLPPRIRPLKSTYKAPLLTYSFRKLKVDDLLLMPRNRGSVYRISLCWRNKNT